MPQETNPIATVARPIQKASDLLKTPAQRVRLTLRMLSYDDVIMQCRLKNRHDVMYVKRSNTTVQEFVLKTNNDTY